MQNEMKTICSMATRIGVGLPLPGVTVTGPAGLQRPGQAGPLMQQLGQWGCKVSTEIPVYD